MLTIRPITDADVEAVAAVHVRTWQVGYAGIIADDYLAGLDVAAFVERRRSRPAPPGARTVVAEEDGRVVGFVSFGPYRLEDGSFDRRTGELYAIYVHPDHWGRGAGRRLIAAARAGLSAAGFAEMRLWVLEENDRARRFYERAGLAPDGAREMYTPRGTSQELPELRYSTAL